MAAEHLAIATPLRLIQACQTGIAQHAILAIATLQLQRRARHRLAATHVGEGVAVGVRRLITQC